MAVSPETEWVLVACGLIAHADGILHGNEAERLMAMVDDRIPEDDYTEWLSIIGDQAKLEARYAALADPPEAEHRTLLEEAWTMSMADGSRSTDELVVLTRIAERLGVEPMQLEFWREAWTRNEEEFAVAVTELAAAVLGGGEPLFEDDVSGFLDVIERLPTSEAERERLAGVATSPPADLDAVTRRLAGMPRSRRIQAFAAISSLAGGGVDDDARTRFVGYGKASGLIDIDQLFPS